MNKRLLILLSALSMLLGILLFLVQYEWIILRLWQSPAAPTNMLYQKKRCQLHYWHHDNWRSEKDDLLWSSDNAANLATLITAWLSLCEVEQIVAKKISIQAVVLTPNSSEAYISFDRNPLNKTWSIKEKIMFFEGLLKTVQETTIPITQIRFLVDHKPCTDLHLDLSFSWPCSGFLNSQLQ